MLINFQLLISLDCFATSDSIIQIWCGYWWWIVLNLFLPTGTNVAYRKPVNQSSATRSGPAFYANDGKPGNQNPDGQECSETQKEASPWWRVDLLASQTVRVVRITTRGCCGQSPLQDLEIRVGNSSTDLQRNPLCAWFPGQLDEGTTKSFTCARPLVGQYVAIQLVGVEGSLSLCEVEVFSNEGKSCNSFLIGQKLSIWIFYRIFERTLCIA